MGLGHGETRVLLLKKSQLKIEKDFDSYKSVWLEGSSGTMGNQVGVNDSVAGDGEIQTRSSTLWVVWP